MKLVIRDHLRVIWHFYALVVLFISFGLLEIFNLLIFLADVLVISFAVLPGVPWVLALVIPEFFGERERFVVGSDVRETGDDFLGPEIHRFLTFRNHIHFNSRNLFG